MRFSTTLVMTLVMSCCFGADLRAEPAATLEVVGSIRVTDLIVSDGAPAEANCCDNSASCENGASCSSRGHGGWGSCPKLPCNWRSTRDMYQHSLYMTEPEDYYYFRPYNHMHIAQQQAEVQNYGLDARNPYANDFFEGVYLEVEAAIRKQAAAQAKPAAVEAQE